MEPSQALLQEADWAARSLQGGDKNAAPEARMRAMSFRPKDGRHYLCPRCWVRHGAKAPLRPRPGTDDYDLLACDTCHADFVIPF